MSVFKANSKYLAYARQEVNDAENLEARQEEIDFRRNILSNIRQQRLGQSQLAFVNYSPDTTSSSEINASSLVNTGFAAPLSYTLDYMKRQDDITEHYNKAESFLDKYEKQAKTAAKVGMATSMIAPMYAPYAMASGVGDRNFIRGGIEGYKASAVIAAKGAAGFASGGPAGAIAGAAAGTASALDTFTNLSGQNRKWAKAQNEINWSTSQYYGTAYNPVKPKSNIKPLQFGKEDLIGLAQAAASVWGFNASEEVSSSSPALTALAEDIASNGAQSSVVFRKPGGFI